MKRLVSRLSKIRSELFLPGDKSISHRALIFNAIAEGKSKISGLEKGLDVMATINCLNQFGSIVDTTNLDEGYVFINNQGITDFSQPQKDLDAKNSGTTIRLMTGILASNPFSSVINGDASLQQRPMRRIIEPISLMGGNVVGMNLTDFPPLKIEGKSLHGIEYSLPVPSAQVKSCIILAGLFANSQSIIHQPILSRDHTETMLLNMGANIEIINNSITVNKSVLRSVDMEIPGDVSAAAYWIVAALCHPDAEIIVKNIGINKSRTGFLEILKNMGADITILNKHMMSGEMVGDIQVRSSVLKGVQISGSIIPNIIDEIPVLALAACFATGKTSIREASELRLKESDRINGIVVELAKLGADIQEHEDGMTIYGGKKLIGENCHSHQDHRLAMMLGIAGILCEGNLVVEAAECSEISYPKFWDDLYGLGSS